MVRAALFPFPTLGLDASWLPAGLQAGGVELAAGLFFYLALVGLGKLVKHRLGVSRLGLAYQLFCVTLAPWLAAVLFVPDLPFRRELGAAAVLCAAAALVRPIDALVWQRSAGSHRATPVPKFVREVSGALLLIIAALLVMTFGYNVSVPGLLAGSSAIILGLALQDTLGNVIAGFALQFGRPFETGDWLLLDGQHAQAVEINWRSSRFRTNDAVQLDVPNQHVVRAVLVNYHRSPGRIHAVRLDIGLDYDAPPNHVKEVLARAAASAEHVLADPAPDVFLKSFGDSAVLYEVRFWLNDHRLFNAARSAVQTNAWYALRRAGLKIPFPIRTLHLERPHAAARHGGESARRDGERHGGGGGEAGELLRAQSLFQGLADEHLQTLLRRARRHPYGRGETIIREGADGASMFVLLRGEAGVTVDVNGSAARVATLHRGDCFGEMSLLTGEARGASVLAIHDCEVLEITKPIFADILARDPGLLPRLGELLARRQLETEGFVQARAADDADGETDRSKEAEYREGFLTKVRAFFEL